jgi:hypothetical protein
MAKNPKPHELRNSNFRKNHGIECSRKPRQIFPERHLFVSEGSKTEPKYIDGIITKICEKLGEPARNQFKTIGDGSCTLTLLERAEHYQKNDSDGFQHVWVIFDKDDFPPDAFDNTVGRCKALNERNEKRGVDLVFHAIWSNQCVELWFLLHYLYLDSDIPRNEYCNKLSTLIGRKYVKNDDCTFKTLLPKLNTAIKHAKRLMNSYSEDTPPSGRTPCTNFYELVTAFLPYLK